jgi:hypothetical protein
MGLTTHGWALIVPIAIFNIVVGLWTLRSAQRHARFIAAQAGTEDPLIAAHLSHPDFPGRSQVSSARAKGVILVLSGLVLLALQYAPAA